MKEETKDSAAESVGLDKLEVGAAGETRDGAPSSRKLVETLKGTLVAAPRLRITKSFDKINRLASKGIWLVYCLLAALLGISAIVYLVVSVKKDSTDHYAGKIVYNLEYFVGKHYVTFMLSIPFKDNPEKTDIMSKLTDIRNRLEASGSRYSTGPSIEDLDMERLRKEILGVVSTRTGLPADRLSLEEFTVYPLAEADRSTDP